MKYSMIQIQTETHQLLKEYCTEHGYKISALVDKIIKNHIQIPSHTKSKEYLEAKAQNDSKNKLAEDMRRCFVDILDTQALQNELTTYELDPIDKTIIIGKTKLKQIKTK